MNYVGLVPNCLFARYWENLFRPKNSAPERIKHLERNMPILSNIYLDLSSAASPNMELGASDINFSSDATANTASGRTLPTDYFPGDLMLVPMA
ncbi:MAG: hypothetical protein Q9172_005831 [Xanthocarpia lactea]